MGGRRRFGALLGALALSAGMVSGGASTAVAAKSPGVHDAISRLGACLASGGDGDVLLVMDTSASLKQTDPDDERVTAAEHLVAQLAKYADRADVDVDLAVAGFADKFEVTTKWTSLDEDSEGSLISDVSSYADRDTGFETDYWNAVEGARAYLGKRVDDDDERRCQAWVWFSDGMYDLDKRDTADERARYDVTKAYGPEIQLTDAKSEARLEKAGRDDLCRKGGLSDRLRGQQIITLAVGLRGDKAADFGLMRGVATGSEKCGRKTDVSVGQFVEAGNMQDVLFAFDAISDPAHPPVEQTGGVCRGEVCPRGTHQFVLDPSISQVQILGGAEGTAVDVVLSGPGPKASLTVKAGQAAGTEKLPGATVDYEWISTDVIQIDLKRTRDKDWRGVWKISFVSQSGEGQSRSNMHLYGDLLPTVLKAGKTRLVAGEIAQIELGLVHADGEKPVDPRELLGDVRVDAELQYPNGTAVVIAEGVDSSGLTEPLKVDLKGATPGEAVVHLSLRQTTASSGGVPGTVLETQAVDVPVTVSAPPSYPTLPGTVSFGQTEETGVVKANVELSGQGCVWLEGEPSVLVSPEGAAPSVPSSSSTSSDSCASDALPLELDVKSLGNGLLSGEMTVMVVPADSGAEPIPVTLRYDLEMQRPRDDGVFYPVLILVMTLGVLIPLALLYLVKWSTAKIPGSSLSVGRLHGTVTATSADVLQQGLQPSQMRGFVLDGQRRRLSLSSTVEIATRAGLGLTETGYVIVLTPHSVSSARPGSTGRAHRARLPLAVQNHWIAVLDPTDPHRGSVEVLFLTTTTGEKLPELISDARQRLPEMVAQMRSKLGEAPPETPGGNLFDAPRNDAFGGGFSDPDFGGGRNPGNTSVSDQW